MNNQWDNNYDYGSNQSQGFYDPSAYNYDAGAADYSVSNPVADGMFQFSKVQFLNHSDLLTGFYHEKLKTVMIVKGGLNHFQFCKLFNRPDLHEISRIFCLNSCWIR